MASCPLGKRFFLQVGNGNEWPLLTWWERKIVDWKNILGRVSGDSYATLGLAVRGSMSFVDRGSGARTKSGGPARSLGEREHATSKKAA